MRTEAPALLPIFRSQHLLETPPWEYTITDLARALVLSVVVGGDHHSANRREPSTACVESDTRSNIRAAQHILELTKDAAGVTSQKCGACRSLDRTGRRHPFTMLARHRRD